MRAKFRDEAFTFRGHAAHHFGVIVAEPSDLILQRVDQRGQRRNNDAVFYCATGKLIVQDFDLCMSGVEFAFGFGGLGADSFRFGFSVGHSLLDSLGVDFEFHP